MYLFDCFYFGPSVRASAGKTLPSTIPRVLYKTGNTAAMHPEIKKLVAEFVKNNPGWTVKYYGNQACADFIKQHFAPDVLDAWHALKPGAFKADLWRLCVLYQFGGAYSDFSQTIMVPIESLIDVEKDELVLVADKYNYVFFMRQPGIHNSFMAAVPKHPWIKRCIDTIVSKVKNRDYGRDFLNITGPSLLGDELRRKPTPNYRMDLVYTPDMYLKYIGSMHPAIRHKLPNHYEILGVKGKSFIKAWNARQVYGN